MSQLTIGFIGLGLMGGNMVECLQKSGFAPVVMDLNQDAVDVVLKRGGRQAIVPGNWQSKATSSCCA